jgi:glutathione peroxidase
MSGKIEVNGAQAHPLYQYLTRSAPGLLGTAAIKWNFTKFLVARNGEVVARYAPTTKPADLTAEIERLLSIPPVEV